MADDLTHDVNHYRITSGYTENSLAFDANAVESSVVPSGLGKQQKLAEYIYQLFSNYHSDNKADGQAIAKLYADLTFHRVYDMLNDFYKDIQGLSSNASPTSTDATDVKTKLDKVSNDVKNLLSDTAPTLQQALKNAQLLGQIKQVVDDILQNIVKTTNDKLDKILENVEDIKNAVSDETKSETQSKSTSTKKTSSANIERTLNYNKVDDKTLDVLNSAIATALAPVKKALASIQKATTANNGLLQYSTQVIKNIDNNLTSYAGNTKIKAVNQRINMTQFRADDTQFSGDLNRANRQQNVRSKTSNLFILGSLFTAGSALTTGVGKIFKSIFNVGSLAFSGIKNVFNFFLSPIITLVKGISKTLSIILTPFKLAFMLIGGISKFLFNAAGFLLKGIQKTLGVVSKLAFGIFKGVFKIISGIFSFLPKAIGGIFKLGFGLVKCIFGMTTGILKWTKTSILDRLKTPAGRNTLAFIAGVIYGFVVEPIKKMGFSKWIGSIGNAVKPLWDSVANYFTNLWNELEIWWKKDDNPIKVWWRTHVTETKVGKAVSGTINWIMSLFEPGAFFGENGIWTKWVNIVKQWVGDTYDSIDSWSKDWNTNSAPTLIGKGLVYRILNMFKPGGFFGKDGTFSNWLDSVQNWWTNIHNDGNFFGKDGFWERWFGPNGKMQQSMNEWFGDNNGKPNKFKQLITAFTGTIEEKAQTIDADSWIKSVSDGVDWIKKTLADLKNNPVFTNLGVWLVGKQSFAEFLNDSGLSKMYAPAIGLAGGVYGAKFGSMFGPWGALIGGIVGGGVGWLWGKHLEEENAKKANFSKTERGADFSVFGGNAQVLDMHAKKLGLLTSAQLATINKRILWTSAQLDKYKELWDHSGKSDQNAKAFGLYYQKLLDLAIKAKVGLITPFETWQKLDKLYSAAFWNKDGKVQFTEGSGYTQDEAGWKKYKADLSAVEKLKGAQGIFVGNYNGGLVSSNDIRARLWERNNWTGVDLGELQEKFGHIRDKFVKERNLYERILGKDKDNIVKRKEIDAILMNYLSVHRHEFNPNDKLRFGDYKDWDRVLEPFIKEMHQANEDSKKTYTQEQVDALVDATQKATNVEAEKEAYQAGVRDATAAAAAGAASTPSYKVPYLGSSVVSEYSITK